MKINIFYFFKKNILLIFIYNFNNRWALENGECVRIFFNYSNITNIDCVSFSNSGKLLAVGCKF